MKYILFFTIWIIIFGSNSSAQPEFQNDSDAIIDCNYTFEESIKGIDIPKSIVKQLTLIDVEYYSFDNKLHKGQLVVNKKAKKDLIEIFEIIKKNKFPVNKVIPVVYYNWSDDASMNDNNSSCFNYRIVKGFGVLSAHSYGMAIDINPIQNPHIKGKDIQPRIGNYDVKHEGTIVRESIIVKEFVKRGWQWGGRWRSSKDYQHFEKKN